VAPDATEITASPLLADRSGEQSWWENLRRGRDVNTKDSSWVVSVAGGGGGGFLKCYTYGADAWRCHDSAGRRVPDKFTPKVVALATDGRNVIVCWRRAVLDRKEGCCCCCCDAELLTVARQLRHYQTNHVVSRLADDVSRSA